MVRSVCHPPFAKGREGWGTLCVVCHRKAGPPADENRQNNAWVIRTILAWPPYTLTPENPGTFDWERP